MTTTEIGFADKFEAAVSLVQSLKSIIVKTAHDHELARGKLQLARVYREQLKTEYDKNPIVMKAKEFQATKIKLDADLDAFVKGLKNGQMKEYEDAEEVKLRAEERRQQAIRLVEAEAERVREIAAQKVIFDVAEKARKLAAKSGDEEAAAQAAADAEAAKLAAKDIASAPVVVPVVVLETSTPTVTRTKRYKWRITTKAGKVFAKEDFKKVTRLSPGDLPGTDAKYFVLDDTLISGVVDSLGENAGIANVEVWSVLV